MAWGGLTARVDPGEGGITSSNELLLFTRAAVWALHLPAPL
jgi:hypothetical protein